MGTDGDNGQNEGQPSEEDQKKAARAEFKSLIKEAIKEHNEENKPKQRTTQPQASIMQQLFGKHF